MPSLTLELSQKTPKNYVFEKFFKHSLDFGPLLPLISALNSKFDNVLNWSLVNLNFVLKSYLYQKLSRKRPFGGSAAQLPPPPPSLNREGLTIACITFFLLLTYRSILGLPEYKLKVVNICEMHGTGVLTLWCYELFDRFQQYVEIVRKSDEKVL